ncbi:MAG: heavy metal-associated domain-containing protein, partial [Eubacteriales bacterium]|nr:heavy metal-associated domain-containing protein [Eubacteriales bacterium]
PYSVILKVDGMTCSNCVRRVENGLNRLDGVWATVDLDKGTALVRMKSLLGDQILKDAVNGQGYRVYGIEKPEQKQ